MLTSYDKNSCRIYCWSHRTYNISFYSIASRFLTLHNLAHNYFIRNNDDNDNLSLKSYKEDPSRAETFYNWRKYGIINSGMCRFYFISSDAKTSDYFNI